MPVLISIALHIPQISKNLVRWIMQISHRQAPGIVEYHRGHGYHHTSRGHYSFVTRRLTATLSPSRHSCYIIWLHLFGTKDTVPEYGNESFAVTPAAAIIHYRGAYVPVSRPSDSAAHIR